MRKSATGRRTPTRRGVYEVAVLGKALELLEALATGTDSGLSRLSARTGVNKATTYRILTTLESRGYLSKDAERRTYHPGPRLVALSCAVVSGLTIVQHARPIIERLHAEFGETVNLGVLSEGEVLYLDMLESQQGLRMAARVGARDPLHSTALGKALLAALTAEELDRVLARYHWARRTLRTITSRGALERELGVIRERGYAVDDGENEEGARCIGAAIRDQHGRPIAALSISAPAARLRDQEIVRIGNRLRTAVKEIEQRMGMHIHAAAGTQAAGT